MRFKTLLLAVSFVGVALTETFAASACNWGNMRSATSKEGRELTVVNRVGDRTAKLYWIDFQGLPQGTTPGFYMLRRLMWCPRRKGAVVIYYGTHLRAREARRPGPTFLNDTCKI